MAPIDMRFGLFLVVAFGLGSGLAYFSMKPQKLAEIAETPLLTGLSKDSIESEKSQNSEISEKIEKAKKSLATVKENQQKASKAVSSEKSEGKFVSDAEAKALFKDLGVEADDLGGAGRGDLKSFKDYSEEKDGEHSGINSSLATRAFEESTSNK